MEYSRYLIETPAFWFTVAGLFAGCAVAGMAGLLRIPRGEHRRRDRVTAVSLLCVTIMVIVATASIFFTNPQRILDLRLLILFVAVGIVVAIMALFPRSVGLPIFILLVVALAIGLMGTLPIQRYYEEIEAARIDIVAVTEGKMVVEWMPHDRFAIDYIELKGDHLAVTSTLFRYSDLLFPFGAPAAYRLCGLVGLTSDPSGSSPRMTDEYLFPIENGPIERLYDLWVELATYLPGIAVEQGRTMPFPVEPLSTWSLRLDLEGRTAIVGYN